jgi:O-antigen/teichoic acid export membrane protein
VDEKILPKNVYARNVITLMTGTGLAQAIPVAISPILTRLYSPEDFGIFALYIAIVSIATVFVTGRYELAILLPKDDRDALHIVALSMLLSCVISALLLLIISMFHGSIVEFLDAPELAGWLYWIPLSTGLLGCFTSLNYWINRKGHYRWLAMSRVAQTGSTSFIQLGAKYIQSGPAGLVVGQLVGQLLASSLLLYRIYREDQKKIKTLRWSRMRAMAHTYRNFPRFLIIAHAFNTASGQTPVLLFSSLFDSATAGFYMLIQRVMGAPMALVAGAIGDVFRQEASQAYIYTGNCHDIYIKTLRRLLILAVPPFTVFFFVAPALFGWFFGEQWRLAGEYARILTPMFFLQFITSPLSSMFMIAEKQRMDLAWQILLFVSTGGSFVVGYLFSNVKMSFVLFSVAYCFMYSINGLMSYRFAKNKIVI